MTVIPVLLYHSVSDHRSSHDHYAVSRASFEAHADVIAASGRTSLRISELANGLRGEHRLPERAVAITFDDGFADTEDAVQSLLARGLQSTIYVTTSELGARDRLTTSQVEQLSQMPSIEIGAHAVRHRYLDELADRELAGEVDTSKVELEDVIQIGVDSFAYPHGAYDKRVRQAVIDAGYSSGAAVKNAVSHPHDDPFAIARWTVRAGTSEHRIAEVLDARDVPLAWSRERVRTRIYRTFRQSRRNVANLARSRRARDR